MTSATEARRSPLHDRHLALGARMGEFGGWTMPIDFAGAPSKLGVIAEHTAVRERVGLFDVSHLGAVTVRGPGAVDHVDTVLTNSVAALEPGQAQYTLCCEAGGGIVDDLIAYRLAAEEVFCVPNAANTAEVARRLGEAAPRSVTVRDEHIDWGVLAVQGPRCDEVLARVGLPTGHAYMSVVTASWPDPRGTEVFVGRTGYTGERGYEVLVAREHTERLWDALLAADGGDPPVPCGLGARDTLRTEMGYPLHGQDISLAVTPVHARLGFGVGWDKADFTGRDALLTVRQAGPDRKLVGLESLGRAIPRPHMGVRDADGALLGEVTSGTFSPTRKQGIALAMLDAGVKPGDEVVVDVRGREAAFRVVRPPFVPSSVR